MYKKSLILDKRTFNLIMIKLKEINNLNIKKIQNFYSNFVNSGQVSLLNNFQFGNDIPLKAKGMYIYFKTKKVLDMTGGYGVLNLGHNHPRLIKARIEFQKKNKLEVCKNFLSPYIASLSKNIAELLPGDLNYSYFPNSGAEAIEGAVKLAYKFHKGYRKTILHSDISFHGKLLGAGGLSSSVENNFSFPSIPNRQSYRFNNFESIKKIINDDLKKNKKCTIYALLCEPISASSLNLCSEKFLQNIQKICNKHKIILIFDEVYTGWYKTGSLFSFMKFNNILPDIVAYSKSFGGGKSSISGYTTRKKVFDKTYNNTKYASLHSTTYNGFGEESITAIEAINIMIEDNYELKAKKIEEIISLKLKYLKNKYPNLIHSYEGRGAHFGIVFKINNSLLKIAKRLLRFKSLDNRFYQKILIAVIISNMYSKYNILMAFGQNYNFPLWISPSLIIKQNELTYFFKCLDQTFSENFEKLFIRFIKNKFFKK